MLLLSWKKKNYKEIKISAVGGSIGKLVDIVEVLKILIPGLYQQNRITSVAYQTVDSNSQVLNQRLYPKLEVILSTEEFKNKNEGTQDKLDEKLRKDIEEIMKKRKEEREKNGDIRKKGRGRGFRGRKDGFRGRRPGFRGRVSRRGGFRRNRGGSRRVDPQRTRVRGRGRGQRGTAKDNRGRGGK